MSVNLKNFQTSNNGSLVDKDEVNGGMNDNKLINNQINELLLIKSVKEDDKIDDNENETEDEENKRFSKELQPVVINKTNSDEKATGQRYNKTKGRRDKDVTIIPKQLKQKHVLSVADTIISLIIIGPLVIGHWRGVWNLMDYYSIPISGWTCFLLGTGLHWIFAVLRGVLHGKFAVTWRSSNPIGRGGYRGIRVVSAVIVILISLLIIFRSCRNLLAPPLIIVVDIPNHIFQFPTRYRTFKNEE